MKRHKKGERYEETEKGERDRWRDRKREKQREREGDRKGETERGGR